MSKAVYSTNGWQCRDMVKLVEVHWQHQCSPCPQPRPHSTISPRKCAHRSGRQNGASSLCLRPDPSSTPHAWPACLCSAPTPADRPRARPAWGSRQSGRGSALPRAPLLFRTSPQVQHSVLPGAPRPTPAPRCPCVSALHGALREIPGGPKCNVKFSGHRFRRRWEDGIKFNVFDVLLSH